MSARLAGVVLMLSAMHANAAGFGLEVGGQLNSQGGGGDAAIDARFSTQQRGGFEVRARGLLNVGSGEFGAMLLPRYRTPVTNFGAFSFSFAGGLGAMYWSECGSGEFCGSFGPVIEMSPTVSLRTDGVVQPYLALNGFVSTMLPGDVRLLLGVGLSLGVSFEFSAAQPTEKLEQLPPEAAPTTPQNPASEPEAAPPP